MAAQFTVKSRETIAHHGHGQNGIHQENTVLFAGTANTGTSYELPTTLRAVTNGQVGIVGTSTMPYFNENAQLNDDGHLLAKGTSVTLSWATAPKDTHYFVTLYGR